MPPEMAVIKELERGTLSMLSDLQSYKNMGINVPSLFGVIYKVDRTKDEINSEIAIALFCAFDCCFLVPFMNLVTGIC
jgi:hypothetical protein